MLASQHITDDVPGQDRLLIRGGAPIAGTVSIGGLKHAMVPIVAASALPSGTIYLRNVPKIEDTRVLTAMLRSMGAHIETGEGVLTIDTEHLADAPLDATLARRVHGSLYLAPTLLARFGHVSLGRTGGCAIGDAPGSGERPTEHVARIMARFGATVDASNGSITARCSRLTAADIDIQDWSSFPGSITGPYVSGATKTAILLAATARGTTRIRNPYSKPDVTELVAFLSKAGVPCEMAGDELTIEGRPELGTVEHELVSDVMEIFTFITCAVHTGSTLRLTGVTTDRARRGLRHELELLTAMGIASEWTDGVLTVRPPPRVLPRDVLVSSQTIYSDNQPMVALLLGMAEQSSVIREQVWRERFDYCHGLARLGMRFEKLPDGIRVLPSRPGDGLSPTSSLEVHARDLRAAAVLVIAALTVRAPTLVTGASHLARGYDDLQGKLRALGASIEEI
ncbi:MAG TPA: hypothetical protein VM580_14565 [Labilithrix sp.]|nr:hypothetical protein [Labilithrix sp.]